MGKKMEVGTTYYTEVEVDASVDIGEEEVTDFIRDIADESDLRKIEEAMSERKGVYGLSRTLEGAMRLEIAHRIAEQYSLSELMDIEKELIGNPAEV